MKKPRARVDLGHALREQTLQAAEIRRLNRENAQLRALFLGFRRGVEEIESNLQTALDKDRDKD